MNNLRNLRKQNNLTMKQLGETIGVAESTISLYETEKREPDIKTLNKLADYFDVSVDYLLGREPQQPVSEWLKSIDDDLSCLIDTWHNLSDTAKLRLLAYAEGLRDNI